MNHLPAYFYWDRNHGYAHDVWYEALNNNKIGATRGMFGWSINVLLEYQLSGYAWGKVLLENPQFFRGTLTIRTLDGNKTWQCDVRTKCGQPACRP
jgi:hypothetical protein